MPLLLSELRKVVGFNNRFFDFSSSGYEEATGPYRKRFGTSPPHTHVYQATTKYFENQTQTQFF